MTPSRFEAKWLDARRTGAGIVVLFQACPTRQRAILVKSLRDAGMASISTGHSLGKATSLPRANNRPICSPFRRLEGAINGS